MKKSIKSKRSPEDFALHQLFSCWGSKEELVKQVTFLEYTKTWVDRVNRGGLLLESDDFYMFLRGIENDVRKVLTINFLIAYCGEDVKEVILGKLNANSFIYNLWDTLTKDVYNKHLTENIKLQILEKWTNIRVNVQNMHYMYRSWEEKLREMKHQKTKFQGKEPLPFEKN